MRRWSTYFPSFDKIFPTPPPSATLSTSRITSAVRISRQAARARMTTHSASTATPVQVVWGLLIIPSLLKGVGGACPAIPQGGAFAGIQRAILPQPYLIKNPVVERAS